MKKYLTLALCAFVSVGLITGCGSKKEDKKKNDADSFKEVKEKMESLSNYDYDAVITVESFMNIETKMSCKDDRVNKITHCTSSSMGIETEEYLDYGNQMDYSYVMGEWTKTKVNVTENNNSYVSLGEYLTDYKETSKDGGKLITGKVSGEKLAKAMSQNGSEDYSGLISGDIDMEIFVNSDGYMEKINFTMEVMGMKEKVEVTFKNFNKAGTVELPAEVK